MGLTICPRGPIFVRARIGASSGRESEGAEGFSIVGGIDGAGGWPREMLPVAGTGDGADRLNVPNIASGKPYPSFGFDIWLWDSPNSLISCRSKDGSS